MSASAATRSSRHARKRDLSGRFEDFVRARPFPCVGAKVALEHGDMHISTARDIGSGWDDLVIHDALCDFVARYRADPHLFQTKVVVFEGPLDLTEAAFEHRLWQRVQSLSDKDGWRGHGYDATVADDPTDRHFSLSFAGHAFFIVGLHPAASRLARRFERPAMVFNLHAQFETLRAQGRYERMREAILTRDTALCGSPNPMTVRHGDASEARQYSGRAVGADWKCPFSRRSFRAP